MRQVSLVIVIFSMILTLGGCATPALEQIRLPGDLSGWKLGHKQTDRLNGSEFSELILETEYVTKWSKKIKLEFYDKKQLEPEAFMQTLKSKMDRVCNNMEVRVLDKQADSILYEWRIKGCKRYGDQTILGRIIRGKQGMHRVTYTEKSLTISPETSQQWQKKLRDATLDTGSP